MEEVAHFLAHQVHIGNHETVRNSLRLIVAEARRRGFEFWTGKEINDWQRARREVAAWLYEQIRESGDSPELSPIFHLEYVGSLPAAPVVWIPIGPSDAAADRDTAEFRYGVRCRR